MKQPDLLIALKPIVKIFEELSIPYFIGGSIASSLYGIARATMDIDIVADITVRHISPLKQNLEDEYYIDEDMMKEALANKSAFNLIHLETAIKVDIFIVKDNQYQKNVLQRKLKDSLVEDAVKQEYYFSSPEDIILNKLLWYKMGEMISERQWLDVLGVIKVQGDKLDNIYLKKWSQNLNIKKLLEKAFQDAGLTL